MHVLPPVLRRLLAAVIVTVLTLSGLGRVAAAADAVPAAGLTIAGLPVHICHADADQTPDGAPPSHDCCDFCALCAGVSLPTPPDFAPFRHAIRIVPPATRLWAPRLARLRVPHLSRGPPVA